MAIPDLSQKVVKETLNLSDGTTLTTTKAPGYTDNEWAETKKWLEDNPEEARRMEAFTKDAGAVRANMQSQTLQDYYSAKLSYGDEQITMKFSALERNPEFAHIFEDIKRGGIQAAHQHSYNEPLMMKISRAVGGVPEETRDALDKVAKAPLTFQEACKWGELKTVQAFIQANGAAEVDSKDHKGITGLGYAIGANRTVVVKALIDAGADPAAVDTSGNTGLHYAAAYGRKELIEYLKSAGLSVSAKNTQGQTPKDLATKNKQTAVVSLL